MSKIRNFQLLPFFESPVLFYLVLLINLVFLGTTKFYPSMDGPAHLYNSNLLLGLIQGNDTIREFYMINSLPIPNWTTHFLLMIFHTFLPAWLAEKVLIILYVSGMALSFRYLIKALNPSNISLSILIFPFIYSFLFHLGFYNFTFSFILFFLTLGFWLRHYSSNKLYHYSILLLLITITYFTNLLIFGFLGLTIGFYILMLVFDLAMKEKNSREAARFGLSKLLGIFMVSVPALALLVIFMSRVTFFPTSQAYPLNTLIKWLNDVRPLIVYDYVKEEIFTAQFLHIMLILATISFAAVTYGKRQNLRTWLKKADILLIPAVIIAILFFETPNGSGAGMMSDRYALMLYVFMMLWIVARSVHSGLNILIIIAILVFHFKILSQHYRDALWPLDKHADMIYKAGSHIEENSIVLPVNLSDHWLETHFSNYLGVEKPMIILSNYEASVGWFPVKWNREGMPDVLLGNHHSISGMNWIRNKKSSEFRQIDHVVIYGKTDKINDPKWKDLKAELTSEFEITYRSKDNYIIVYEQLKN